jgi:hypothetical protein
MAEFRNIACLHRLEQVRAPTRLGVKSLWHTSHWCRWTRRFNRLRSFRWHSVEQHLSENESRAPSGTRIGRWQATQGSRRHRYILGSAALELTERVRRSRSMLSRMVLRVQTSQIGSRVEAYFRTYAISW